MEVLFVTLLALAAAGYAGYKLLVAPLRRAREPHTCGGCKECGNSRDTHAS